MINNKLLTHTLKKTTTEFNNYYHQNNIALMLSKNYAKQKEGKRIFKKRGRREL